MHVASYLSLHLPPTSSDFNWWTDVVSHGSDCFHKGYTKETVEKDPTTWEVWTWLCFPLNPNRIEKPIRIDILSLPVDLLQKKEKKNLDEERWKEEREENVWIRRWKEETGSTDQRMRMEIRWRGIKHIRIWLGKKTMRQSRSKHVYTQHTFTKLIHTFKK